MPSSAAENLIPTVGHTAMGMATATKRTTEITSTNKKKVRHQGGIHSVAMVKGLLARIRSTSDHRGKQILKNILWSAGLKGVNALISFIIVPLYLSLLTELSFGIWLTVSAVLQWFNFFDLGIGNGLRNKLAEALAEKNDQLGRIYVSTTYALVSCVAVGMIILFFIANFFFDWAEVFEAPAILAADVNEMVVILFCLF